jgi:hypothetical protein
MLDAIGCALPLLAVGMMLVASHFADRSGHRKAFVRPFLVVGAVAFGGSYLLGVSSSWPAFVLLVIADDAMYAPYRPFFAGISDRHRARRRRGDRLDQQLRRAGLLRRCLARHAHRKPARVLLLMAASLLINGLITLAVGAEEVRAVAAEEVRAVAAGLSPHP